MRAIDKGIKERIEILIKTIRASKYNAIVVGPSGRNKKHFRVYLNGGFVLQIPVMKSGHFHVLEKEFVSDKKRITVLFDVVNPTNVGAIIRSAAALGMDGALLSYASVDPLTRRSARVSMGTVFQMPWTKASKEESEGINLIRTLQSYGFKTVAMALTEDSTSIDNDEIRANEKLAVIMGTEGTGLPKDVIAACDYRVMIPMYHGVDSLNVAAASAISFWELLK